MFCDKADVPQPSVLHVALLSRLRVQSDCIGGDRERPHELKQGASVNFRIFGHWKSRSTVHR